MGTIYTAPTSIPSDSEDESLPALQAWIDTVPNGSPGDPNTITFPFDGVRYLLNSGSITFPLGREWLVVVGNGCEFAATRHGETDIPNPTTSLVKGRGQWHLDQAHHMEMRDMVVRGSNPNTNPLDVIGFNPLYEAQHNFQLRGAKHVKIHDVECYSPWGEFVLLGRPPTNFPNVTYTEDIEVWNLYGRNAARMGIGFTGAVGVHIHDVDMANVQRSVFDIEANDVNSSCRDITVEDSLFGVRGTFFFAAVGWPSVNRNILVQRNTLLGAPLTCYVQASSTGRRANYVFRHNTSDTPFGSTILAAMTFIRVDGVKVHDNVVPLQPNRRMYAVRTYDCCDVEVHSNTNANGDPLSTGTTQYGEQGELLVSNTAQFEAGFGCGPRPQQVPKVPKPAPAITYGSH